MFLRTSPVLLALVLITSACGGGSEQVVSVPEAPAAQPEEAPKRNAILARFGSSHGMCIGYCTQEYELKGDGLTARRKGGGRGDPKTHPADQEQTVALDKATIDAAMTKLEAAAFDAAPDVIGCPDCADGGRCWVEVTRDGKPRTITFDCSSGSESLKPFTDALWKLTEEVKWPDTDQEEH